MFKLIKIENGRMNVPEPEYFVANAALTAGQSVALSGGKLVSNTAKPTHITLGPAKEAGDTVPCTRIDSSQVYEVAITAAPTSLNVGDKVTIDTSAASVTATKDGGVVTIVSLNDATTAGEKILVRF